MLTGTIGEREPAHADTCLDTIGPKISWTASLASFTACRKREQGRPHTISREEPREGRGSVAAARSKSGPLNCGRIFGVRKEIWAPPFPSLSSFQPSRTLWRPKCRGEGGGGDGLWGTSVASRRSRRSKKRPSYDALPANGEGAPESTESRDLYNFRGSGVAGFANGKSFEWSK